MKVLLQRVQSASVAVADEVVGQIGPGLLLLVCAEHDDDEVTSQRLIDKVTKLRIFSDDQGKMNRSVLDVGGDLLIVSQFTLVADTSKGNRPSYSGAAEPAIAKRLYDCLIEQARATGLVVQSGRFGADMKVSLINDGPVTIPLSMESSQ
ncbi:D-aminoacyl-tRNA deacylase [Orrella daihaiensis]|uniref:D-aminoacyl-tRNA deacylase n=1 Tax=Orrella daihaiensis TaxID=2782176 RepID=A0ABY4AK01_9BURK|nr:D-aminoacyl-tRNA deacylase [Orrella daihaiensis]UOD49435.1 D-tyrosyl-tRNA(Tyr) deacylase [Orrella daihaiensis]